MKYILLICTLSFLLFACNDTSSENESDTEVTTNAESSGTVSEDGVIDATNGSGGSASASISIDAEDGEVSASAKIDDEDKNGVTETLEDHHNKKVEDVTEAAKNTGNTLKKHHDQKVKDVKDALKIDKK